MIQDQNVNNTWKNLVGGLYETFNKWKPSRQMMGGFMNDRHFSFQNLSQEKIQNAIDIQQKIMEQLLLHREVIQPIWSVDLRQKENDFYEKILKWDSVSCLRYGRIAQFSHFFEQT